MSDYLEIWSGSTSELVPLGDSPQRTIGRLPENDLCLEQDAQVSRSHAVIERIGLTWLVRDLNSTNGTYVDGHRIYDDRVLRPNCEVRVGQTRMVFRSSGRPDTEVRTIVPQESPQVTPREKDVLIGLFRDTLPGEMFFEPASTRDIAQSLGVSDAAVKQHLLHLYDKFSLVGNANRTRSRLANEALRRGVLQLAEVRAHLARSATRTPPGASSRP